MLLIPSAGSTNNTHLPNDNTSLAYHRLEEGVINQRITHMDMPFTAQVTPEVRRMIRRFLVEGQLDSRYILGRAAVYFPIFEHYLRLYNLPEELKYLPIIESSLRPAVQSPVGAAGLWQFVPETARLYGLKVNAQVDERLDPHRSTEAAVRMLASLYARFNDWGLALAAYNCGPGRVGRAVRQTAGKDYWAVQALLPKESQRYVPRFIAAAYLMNYYQTHELQPRYPSDDMLHTRTFYLTQSLRLNTVARRLGITYQTLTRLNPSYRHGQVILHDGGAYLTVPTAVAPLFEQLFLNEQLTALESTGTVATYVTVAGDKLETLAQLFQCSPADIMRWNGLKEAKLTANQLLRIYLPQQVVQP